MTTKKQTGKNELDGPWKHILSSFLHQFMELCLPKIADQIDWSKSYQKLSAEFEKRITENVKLKRIADTVFEVHMKNGKKKMLLVHLEIQGQKQPSFPKRMHEYNFLISEVVNKDVISIAILLDKELLWRPDVFERVDPFLNKPYLQFYYHVVKIADHEEKLDALKLEKNIFSLALRAQLAIMKTDVETEKLEIKLELTEELLKLGLSKEQTYDLYKFIDWLIYLPTLMKEYNKRADELADAYEAPYISTAQQVIIKSREEGIKEGLQEGIKKGEATFLSDLLQCRFPRAVTAKYLELVNGADIDTLSMWGKKLLNAKSIDDVFSGETPLHS